MKLTAAAVVLSVLVLAGCGDADGPGTAAGATSTGPASSAAEAVPTGIPSPDATETAALLDQLAGVVPALAGPTDEDAVTRARNTCQTLLGVAGEPDPAGAARYLMARAAADSIVVSADQADQAVKVIEATFCPTS